MSRAMTQIGTIKCHCCSERIPLKEQANGLAMYSCDWCGFKGQTFATKSDKALREQATLAVAPAAAPAAAAGPAVPAAAARADTRPAYLRK